MQVAPAETALPLQTPQTVPQAEKHLSEASQPPMAVATEAEGSTANLETEAAVVAVVAQAITHLTG